MAGRNTTGTATVLLETGMVPMREPVTELVLEAPAGLIRVTAGRALGEVTHATFQNVPSFFVALAVSLEVRSLWTVRVEVAYGGTVLVCALRATTCTGCLVEAQRVGPSAAVVPTLTGSAWIASISQYVLDAEDPFPEGFTLRDIW